MWCCVANKKFQVHPLFRLLRTQWTFIIMYISINTSIKHLFLKTVNFTVFRSYWNCKFNSPKLLYIYNIESPLCAQSAATLVERCSSVFTSMSVSGWMSVDALQGAPNELQHWNLAWGLTSTSIWNGFLIFSNFAPVYPQGPKRGVKLIGWDHVGAHVCDVYFLLLNRLEPPTPIAPPRSNSNPPLMWRQVGGWQSQMGTLRVWYPSYPMGETLWCGYVAAPVR